MLILNTISVSLEMVNSSKAGIMLIANVLSIMIGRYAIQVRGLGPSIPLGVEGFGLPELIATTSLGHIIGAGAILGLSSIGSI